MPISDKAESRVSPMLFLRHVWSFEKKENDLSASELPIQAAYTQLSTTFWCWDRNPRPLVWLLPQNCLAVQAAHKYLALVLLAGNKASIWQRQLLTLSVWLWSVDQRSSIFGVDVRLSVSCSSLAVSQWDAVTKNPTPPRRQSSPVVHYINLSPVGSG